MHELAHLKSKDIFINWVITLLSMIYWFNPTLLYSFHKMRQDCEFSCDGQAISYLDEGENLQYGNAIIRVLELGGTCNRLVGSTSMVMNSLELKRRIIMISKYKKVNIKNILLGTFIVVIIGGLGIALNTSKLQVEKAVTIAEEFGKNLYTADAQKVAEFKKFRATTLSMTPKPDEAAAYLKIIQSLDKNIQPLMTKEAFEDCFAHRYNTLSSEICAMGNYTLQVTDFILDKNLYGEEENKAGYNYEAKLKFTSTNGKAERTDTSKGYIGLLKENGQWKVFAYKLVESPKLYNELMMNNNKLIDLWVLLQWL